MYPSQWKAPMLASALARSSRAPRAPRARSMGVATAPAQITGEAALQFLQGRYAKLSQLGALLQELTRVRGKALPCSTLDLYHRAVKDYLMVGQQIMNQFAAQGIEVRQTVLQNGQPVADPDAPGGIRSLTIAAPLKPPIFVTRDSCPNITHLSGAPHLGAAGFGVPPVIALLIAVVVASGAVLGINELRGLVVEIRRPDPGAAERIDAMTACLARVRGVLGIPEGAVLTPALANQLMLRCQLGSGGWSTMGIIGAVAVVGVIVGGGAWVYWKGLPALRERADRRDEARAAADRLEYEASEKQRQAKRLRRGRGRTAPAEAEYFPPGEAAYAGANDGQMSLGCPCAL